MNESVVTAEELLKISGGYWRSNVLHAGIRLGVFEELAPDPTSARDLAERLNVDEDALCRLLTALVGMGLVHCSGTEFSSTETSRRFLARNSGESVASMIAHHSYLAESWSCLHESIRSGQPNREPASQSDSEARDAFLRGMFDQAMLVAPQLVRGIDISDRKTLLDIGGGPGTYSLHFCARNPQLEAIVFDLPTTQNVADSTIARFQMEDRVRFIGGDFLEDPIPSGCDTVWISHILHSFDDETCRKLLTKVMASLAPGGLLFVHDFILNNDRSGPPFPAMFSLNMLLATTGGRTYTATEFEAMLTDSGAHNVRRLPVVGPNDSGVFAATV
ncbi:MAG: methyltransferase domain-containing protein [bacterium]|nr:methyltransferase domain-containing protein [bacterium]